MAEVTQQRFNILDPLRLAAAFCVVFYHYRPLLKEGSLSAFFSAFQYGYLGVNFFFMLSGFVIMASCQNRGAIQFALARALRIYPAFIACLLITISLLFFLSGETHSFLQIISNAFIVNDYIGQSNIDGVYWTLQAELKFYMCVFALAIFGLIKYWRVWLIIWLFAAIAHHFFNQPFFLGWFISPAYSFYFIGGVSAYLLSKNPGNKLILFVFLMALVFSSLKSFLQASWFIRNAEFQDGAIASFIVVIFFAFFYFLAIGRMQISKWSFFPLMGAISYPLYLIHNKAGKAIIGYSSQFFDVSWAIVVTIILVVLMSLFVCLFVERRIFSFFRGRL